MKRGFTLKNLAALLSSPDRKIEETQVRKIFTTYIQLMYKIFRDMQTVMFPERAHLRHFIPKVFKMMKNIRCIVDCTEFRVECSRNFARQGNAFSSYKHTNIFKCLIVVTRTRLLARQWGGGMFPHKIARLSEFFCSAK